MGGVDNICSDKTGTLTNNQMILTDIYINRSEYSIETKKTEDVIPYSKIKMDEKT